MITFSEKEKELIENTKGTYSTRGAIDDLSALERKFGKEARERTEKEMEEMGYSMSKVKKTTLPVAHFIVLLLVQQKVLNLSDEDMREVGKESARTSFILKFASKLLVSLETLCKNTNVAWRKYYSSGELKVIEINKEEKRIVAELVDFVGHPAHCFHLEGYFEQMLFFVVGKDVTCREEACPLKNEGDVHRFVLTWE